MKITALKIHNFRGVKEADLNFSNYSLLVGANNAGKSSIIDALRAFYEKDGFKYKPEADFPFLQTADKDSWVEVGFGLSDTEHESLADEYKTESKGLRVRKYLQTAQKGPDGKSIAGLIFGYKTDGTLSTDPFYGAKNVQSGKFGELIYIPAVSKVDEHTKLSGPSALRDLLTDIMTDVVEAGTAYSSFSSHVQTFATSISTQKTTDDRSLSGFQEELNKLLKSWQTAFNLKFTPPTAAEIIKSMLGWELLDQSHGKAQGIENYGSGFQRHFIYSLIQLGSQYVRKKAVKKTKEFAPSMTLILFEEPEAFLHPPQQEVLARSLTQLASNEHWQVICASHSAHFVSKNSDTIPAIVRVRRTAGEVQTFQISSSRWASIVNANQALQTIARKYAKLARRLHSDDAKPEMEAVKHFLWLNPDRCSMFFANHVLLVEGVTEVALLNKLVGEGKIKNADCGLYVLDCIGKYNIHRFMNLCAAFGIRHSVIHDDDEDRDEHAEVNQLIEASKDSRHTAAINRIPKDLETFLGIPSAGPDHRKPQHVLFLYENGAIDPSKLATFCTLVDSSLC